MPQAGRHRPTGDVPAPRTPPEADDPPTEQFAAVPAPAPPRTRRAETRRADGGPAEADPAESGPAENRRATPTRRATGSRRGRRPSRVRRAVVVGGLTVLAAGAVAGVAALRQGDPPAARPIVSDPAAAAVGDCVAGRGNNDLAVVACDASGATDRVVAKVTGTRAAFDADTDLKLCDAAPETDSAYYAGPDTGSGAILCLVPLAANR